mmetsp:Transcript_19119/g.30403  ORF Transcript_19119/g.30403 Transcript_19119/m.30403 type:complete len:161 (+) Transcript_19119:49-531(+)|eukprot:CAMPEP_0202710388 /NCGR_PEP_ID=MMETSP1385-20130828/22374_1 /ASSEMBLY_ACC=CAM_ASM_000861 /TAXON_ID=933848 /ORGANISM="Elphidium margaritaceum" /LENGTH=160 /DNA_ID=CAMNT_0049369913 /DNA_START=47 /DNA_END=529 /DNA_ORIENTATION=+
MRMLIVVFTVIIAVYNAASTISVSYKNCTSSNAIGKLDRIEFVPNSPQLDEKFLILGYGSTSQQLDRPSYNLKVDDGFINKNFNEDACEPFSYDFPLNTGSLDYNPIACPVSVGNVVTNITGLISSKAPSGTATTIMKIFSEANQAGAEVICVEVDMVIS